MGRLSKKTELLDSYAYRGYEAGRRDFDAGIERRHKIVSLVNTSHARDEREAFSAGYTSGYRPLSELEITLASDGND